MDSTSKWDQQRWILTPLFLAKVWWERRPSQTSTPFQSFPRISSRTFLDLLGLTAKRVSVSVAKIQLQKFAPPPPCRSGLLNDRRFLTLLSTSWYSTQLFGHPVDVRHSGG